MKYKDEEIDYALWQVLRGNKSAFLIIYNAYYRMAVSILRRVLRTSEVDEAVNEAFLMVYRGLKKFKQQSKLSTYVYRIILNYAFYLVKKAHKRKSLHHSFMKGESIEDIAGRYNIEKTIVERYFLEQALSALNKNLTETLDLYYFQNYSMKEIAQICNTSENAVRSRLFQARRKIRDSMPEGAIYAG